jgi:hypothetical protein
MRKVLVPVAALLWASPGIAAADEVMPAGPKEYGWFGTIDETARTVGIDYFGPRDDFDEQFRDIDVAVVTMTRGWRTSSGFELQLGGGMLIAEGTRHEPFSVEPVQDSDAFGLLGGGLIRYNLPSTPFGRAFIDASIQVLWAERPFPAGGSAVNGLVRWGGGFAVPLGAAHAVEFGYRRAHVSNGGETSVANPAWNGEGFFLGWRTATQ